MNDTFQYVYLILSAAIIAALIVYLFLRLFRKKGDGAAPRAANAPRDAATRTAPEAPRTAQAPIPAPQAALAAAPVFTLTMGDILGHIDEMKRQSERFQITASLKKRTKDNQPDYLMCGGRCYAIVFAISSLVYNLFLFIDDEKAHKYAGRHTVYSVDYLPGDYWHNLIINPASTGDKREIFDILDECYMFTLMEFYTGKKIGEAEQRAQQAALEKRSEENIDKITAAAKEAEKEHREAEKKTAEGSCVRFLLTRREIVEEAAKAGAPAVTAVERPDQPQLPVSLKIGDRTYAMLYCTDTGVLIVARLAADYAARLMAGRTDIRRAVIPKGQNWYQIPVNGFADRASVFAVLKAARESLVAAKKS